MVFRLAAAFRCSREAGAIDQLNEHAVRGTRMKERHKTINSLARRAIDKLDAVRGQANERGGEIVDDEAKVVKRRATAFGDEAGHAGLRVGRLEKLDA